MGRAVLTVAGCMCMVLGALGCATTTTVKTNPDGALVSVDGKEIGNSPANYTFDFLRQSVYRVTASKPGHFDASVSVASDGLVVPKVLTLNLKPDESYAQTTTTEATNRWLRIQVPESVKQDEVWQKLVDAVTGRYSGIEQMDNSSGYLRSAPTGRSFKDPSGGEFSVRTQFQGAVSSRSPIVYKVKIVSERSTPGGNWVPFDRVFKEDAELLDELQTRLGGATASVDSR
jgi:hypothetical protein